MTTDKIIPNNIPTSYAKLLLQTAEQQGCDVEPLFLEPSFQELGIERSEIESSSHFSAVKYAKLYQRLMQVLQDESLGMFSGGKVRPGSFRILCLTLLHCADLRQAIVRSGEFSEICRGTLVRSRLEVDGATARMFMAPIKNLPQDEFSALQSMTSPHKIRTSLAVWHRMNGWLISHKIPLDTMKFTFDRPQRFQSLAEPFSTNLLFNQNINGIEFPSKYLDYPVVQNQETLMDFLRTAPYHLVINDNEKHLVKTKVRAILARDVSGSMPGAGEVASRLNLSVTTLRRKLQYEDTSFQKIKDECRMEAAFQYLSCPDFTNSLIAERLGFDESSTFFRAFKKWTGITPGEYRKTLGL